MGWATIYIARLIAGETVSFRPLGHSMSGRIGSGQLCTVEPIGDREPDIGNVVLCKVGRSQYLHLVKAKQGNRYQIGNNKGGINGWVTINQIYGILLSVED